tara:strand:+ start:5792 stop:6769 length:978 start_codon:yes stop_codon:yes gene_type:complete
MLKFLYYSIVSRQEHLEILPHKKDINLTVVLIFFFKKNYRSIYNYLQRLILNPKIRGFFINLELFFKKKNLLKSPIKLKKNLIELNKNGITFLSKIKSVNFQKIYHSLNKIDKLYSAYQNNRFYYKSKKSKKIRMGYIDTMNLISNEEILKLINNENIISIVNHYLGANAIFDNIWAWWSFAGNEKPLGPQNFHRDYNSLNFVKLFVYLTDVDENSGPHVFVKCSAKQNILTNTKRFSDDVVKQNFKKNKIIKIKGKKFKLFLANTFSLHKGLSPRKKNRLLLCILYSVNPSRGCPKVPILKIENLKYKNLYKKNKYLNKMYIKY